MSYNAVVCQLKNVRPFPEADRIQLANALGYQVVVGIDAKEDDIVVLFADDGALSVEYLAANNLVGVTDPTTGVKSGGFFSANGRVRAQTFRKQRSEAYTADLNSFKFTGYDVTKLSVGDAFCELNGVSICHKYYTPATKKATQANPASNKSINAELKKLFPEHKDTDQFRFAEDYQLKGLVTITGKQHGTSQRTGCILMPIEEPITNPLKIVWNIFVDEILHGKRHILNFWTDDVGAAKLKFRPKVTHEWEVVYGTRRVFKGKVDPKATDYRQLCAMKIAPYIKKGELWYYEILGYEDTGAAIMGSVDTSKMGKEFVKRFGKSMTYKYGCLPGTCRIEVYRITQTLPDGSIIDLPWPMVKERCNNSMIPHVPQLKTILIEDPEMLFVNYNKADCNYDDGNARWTIREYIDVWTEDIDMAEPSDPSHIREGIVIRIDNLENGHMKLWKNKNFAFKVLEGIIKDSDTYVDAEEAEGVADEL